MYITAPPRLPSDCLCPHRQSSSVAVDYKAKLLKFTLLLLVAKVAALGAVIVFCIIIGVTLGLVIAHWIYLTVWRAWQFMRRELANPLPLIPAATARANTYFVPGLLTYQQQVPWYGVGGAFPSAPGYQSSVYNKEIQEVCRRVAEKILRGNLGEVK